MWIFVINLTSRSLSSSIASDSTRGVKIIHLSNAYRYFLAPWPCQNKELKLSSIGTEITCCDHFQQNRGGSDTDFPFTSVFTFFFSFLASFLICNHHPSFILSKSKLTDDNPLVVDPPIWKN